MSLTVIPAPDNSAASAGWQALSESIDRRRANQRDDYQKLIRLLSDPNTTEEQQNAILTQDPKQFKSTYGVDISKVGKDVSTFRNVATPLNYPGGMIGQGQEFAGNKRLLVAHPTGTPQEQAQQAELGKTQAQTRQANVTTTAEEQRTQYYQQQLGLNADEARQKEVAFTLGLRNAMRTADGKTPTPGQVKDYMAGTFDLYPTTETGKKLEATRELLGGDSNDPATKLAQIDLVTDHNIKIADLDRVRAETEAARSLADERAVRMQFIGKGINPDTGKPFIAGQEVDPKELMSVSKSFDEGFNGALGTLGFPSKAMTRDPLAPLSLQFGRWKLTENPKLAAALFGNGASDPASVRADLSGAIEGGRPLKTISFPTVDPKTKLPATVNMTLDQAVPAVVQMRRAWATSMPAAFTAMRAVSPQVLLEMARGNPTIEQMAHVYAPDIAEKIAQARAATAPPVDAKGAPVDPNIAPILELRDQMTREVDAVRKMIQGKAETPRSDAAR